MSFLMDSLCYGQRTVCETMLYSCCVLCILTEQAVEQRHHIPPHCQNKRPETQTHSKAWAPGSGLPEVRKAD